MNYVIREMRASEYKLLDEFLYYAIFIPQGMTPSLAISVCKEYRDNGIGSELMRNILSLLRNSGYKRVSLSVQKANYATKMYEKVGFHIVSENEEVYIMINELT